MMNANHPYWHNKVALVTGGSSGIGLETARLLAARGARVWLLARHRESLEAALAGLKNDPNGRGGVAVADVADALQVNAAVEQVVQQAGVPDLVVNSAGVTYPGYFQDLDLDIFHQMMEINYFGTLNVIKAVLPGMLERGSGYIVNISSMTGFIGVFGYTAYGASKFAVRGLSDTLRSELKPLGIRLSIVFPLDTDTPQLAFGHDLKPLETKALASVGGVMSPVKVAKSILRGVERSRYVILPGWESKLWYYLIGLAGNLTYPVIDWLIRGAQRDMRKKSRDINGG